MKKIIGFNPSIPNHPEKSIKSVVYSVRFKDKNHKMEYVEQIGRQLKYQIKEHESD